MNKEIISPGMMALLVGAGAFLALLPAWHSYDIIARDGAFQYIPMARTFLEGRFREGFLDYPQLPLFPLMMAGVSLMTGLDLELSGRVASYLGYVLAAAGMYQLSWLLFRSQPVSVLAALFLITNAQLMNRSVDCLKESWLLVAVIVGNYLVIRVMTSLSNKGMYYAWALAAFLAGALLRSTALIFPFAWLVLWIFSAKKGWHARAALLMLPAACVPAAWFLVPEFPLFQKSCYHFGYFFVSWHGLGDLLASSARVARDFFLTGNPGVMLLGIYGLCLRRRDIYAAHVMLATVMFLLILSSWIYASSRYFLAPIIWMYPLAAYGAVQAFSSGKLLPRALAVLAVLSCLGIWAHISLTPPDAEKVASKEAGLWILERVGPDREILSNSERLVFYARGKCLPLSLFREAGPLMQVLAVDTREADAEALDSKLHSLGYRPDKRIRSISVYLPRPEILTKQDHGDRCQG